MRSQTPSILKKANQDYVHFILIIYHLAKGLQQCVFEITNIDREPARLEDAFDSFIVAIVESKNE
jgi:hypothetical protein